MFRLSTLPLTLACLICLCAFMADARPKGRPNGRPSRPPPTLPPTRPRPPVFPPQIGPMPIPFACRMEAADDGELLEERPCPEIYIGGLDLVCSDELGVNVTVEGRDVMVFFCEADVDEEVEGSGNEDEVSIMPVDDEDDEDDEDDDEESGDGSGDEDEDEDDEEKAEAEEKMLRRLVWAMLKPACNLTKTMVSQEEDVAPRSFQMNRRCPRDSECSEGPVQYSDENMDVTAIYCTNQRASDEDIFWLNSFSLAKRRPGRPIRPLGGRGRARGGRSQ